MNKHDEENIMDNNVASLVSKVPTDHRDQRLFEYRQHQKLQEQLHKAFKVKKLQRLNAGIAAARQKGIVNASGLPTASNSNSDCKHSSIDQPGGGHNITTNRSFSQNNMNNNSVNQSSLLSQLGDDKLATLKELWAATKRVRDHNLNDGHDHQNVTIDSLNSA